MGNIQNQIDEMENLITAATAAPATDPPGTEAPGTESTSTEAPGTEAPSTESAATEVPGTSAPSTDAPATDAPATEVPDDRYVQLEKDNEELRKKLDEKHKPSTTSAPSTEVPISLEAVDFIGDVDVREVTEDKDGLNKLLNKVFVQGIETARKTLGEGVLRQIPDIVKHNVVTMTALKKASDKFYEDNEDLKPFKKVVGAVFEEVASENSDWTYEKVMEETGTEARKRLELHKKATNDNKNRPPRLPRKKGGRQNRQAPPKTTGFESELDAMDKAIS